MRYPASEKLKIIRLVEKSHLPAKQTLDRLGIARPTFYRWYDLYQRFGEDALEDRRPGPKRAWNRIPEEMQDNILDMALERCELSPRELAVTFTDEQRELGALRLPFSALLRIRVGGQRLPLAQDPRPDHQPELHRDEGRQRVQG